MEIIKNKINKQKLNKNINLSKDTCSFDIETTGFNRNSDIIYLIGILYFDKKSDTWILVQYFANNLKDEPSVIIESAKLLMNFDTIVNYNGNTFDIPFINHKLRSFGFSISIDKEKSLDLYSIIRKNKKLLGLGNLKLKSVEKYLGIYREDVYSGKDCIQFYKDYILTGDKELKRRLLAHNFEDLYFLIDIIDVLDMIKTKKSFQISKDNEIVEFLIEDISQSKDSLSFKGTIDGLGDKFIYYGNNFNVLIEDTNHFNITIYTNKGLVSPNEIAVFIDKNEFNLSQDLKSSHFYKIPENIFLLKIESNYLLEDIIVFLKDILNNII